MSYEIKFKKIYFLGAGSTASLGMPTTQSQEKILKEICFDGIPRESECKTDTYNIELLKNFVNTFFNRDNFSLNLLLNIIDSKIQKNLSIQCNDKFYSINDLHICKDTLRTIVLNEFYDKIKQRNDNNNNYMNMFYKKLAEKALNSKLQNLTPDKVLKRDFIFTDYAIINYNWDLYSIMPMLMAHKELNEQNRFYTSINGQCYKVKIFNDFASFMACNPKGNNDVWYPYNESVAIRINDTEHKNDKLVTLVKTFYPHGLANLYSCKFCGKHTLNIGNITFESVLKHNLVNNEKILTCPHCGNDIHELDTDYEPQTNYKTGNSYLEEIYLDMLNAIKNTEELVFIGYSLPDDDNEMKEMFYESSVNIKKVKVLLYDTNLKNNNQFYEISEIKNKLSDENLKTANRFYTIFGNKVTFNFAGCPAGLEQLI